MKNLLLIALFFVSYLASASMVVQFRSKEGWESSRWYVVGQIASNEIAWLSGVRSKLNWDKSRCGNAKKNLPIVASLNDSDAEVLIDQGWIAVQVDPDKKSDVLALNYGQGCEVKVPIKWAPDPGVHENVLAPYLFLNPTGNVYMGYEFNVVIPKPIQVADILIDVIGGGWRVHLGNPGAGAKSNIYALPVVQARGEWSPSVLRGIGFELHMLQGLSSFGGVTGQDILVSEWNAGAYFQHIFAVGQGMVLRVHADFFQHLIDQGTSVVSVGSYEADHRGLNLGLSFSQYFAKRWHVQVRGDYGYPSRMAGMGLNQSYLRYYGHLGYLVTDSVTWMVESGYRLYGYEGHNSTKVLSVATGFRLEL